MKLPQNQLKQILLSERKNPAMIEGINVNKISEWKSFLNDKMNNNMYSFERKDVLPQESQESFSLRM